MPEKLSTVFNRYYSETIQEQERQARTAFIALLNALDNNGHSGIQDAINKNDSSSRFVLAGQESQTMVELAIGARESGAQDRVVTLNLSCDGELILSVSQTRQTWDERPSGITFLEGTVNDLLTLSGAMTQAETLLEEEKACPQPNNPARRTRPVYATLGDALGKTYEFIKDESALAQGNQAQCAIAGILDRLDRAQNGKIRGGFEGYDRLSLAFEDGDLSIGVQISPRAKLGTPRTVMISVSRGESPVLEASLTKAAWQEPFTKGNLPTFYTGNLQTLLNLSTALKDSNFLSSPGKLARPKDPVPA